MNQKKIKLSAAAKREQNWGWIMVAPTIIGLLVLNVWPFIQTLYASFCEHLGFGHYKFIGFGNYITMFQNADFWKATWNTVYFCILTVPVGLFLSLLVAILLNAKIKGKSIFRFEHTDALLDALTGLRRFREEETRLYRMEGSYYASVKNDGNAARLLREFARECPSRTEGLLEHKGAPIAL